jgi:hypothetical protein
VLAADTAAYRRRVAEPRSHALDRRAYIRLDLTACRRSRTPAAPARPKRCLPQLRKSFAVTSCPDDLAQVSVDVRRGLVLALAVLVDVLDSSWPGRSWHIVIQPLRETECSGSDPPPQQTAASRFYQILIARLLTSWAMKRNTKMPRDKRSSTAHFVATPSRSRMRRDSSQVNRPRSVLHCRLSRGPDSPYAVADVIGNQEGSGTIHGDPYRTAKRLAVHYKAGENIDRQSRRTSIRERYKDHFISTTRDAVP